MNSKLVKASLAGVAALALAAGGSTFAAWSDFADVTGNSAGAGELVLNIEGPNGQEAVQQASFGNFAPGEGQDVTRYLASQQGDAVPTANLSVVMNELKNADNLCSSNSEAAEDSCEFEDAAGGEFGQSANIKIQVTGPTTAGSCGQAGSATLPYSEVYNGSINGLAGISQALGSLSDGQGVCMKSTVTLPHSATNNSQGDSATWDWHFDLVQP
jgi:predicted ribosomally synthesized peptide with SipW-like signal peptide